MPATKVGSVWKFQIPSCLFIEMCEATTVGVCVCVSVKILIHLAQTTDSCICYCHVHVYIMQDHVSIPYQLTLPQLQIQPLVEIKYLSIFIYRNII